MTAREKETQNRGPGDERKVLVSNRRARRDYDILDTLEAGLVLVGTEVKSARQGRFQIKESHVELRDGEAYLVGAHIGHYSHGNRQNHEPERPRKLLLKRRQIDRLQGQVQLKGLTIIPLAVILSGNWIKVEIAVAQGKKLHDKRQAERKKTQDREMREALKSR
jgi:SsrA-binding protein